MKKVILFFCFLIIVKASAQKHELGNVTIDELKEKSNPNDSSAVATVLFNKGKTYLGYNGGNGTITEIQVKIKIYKKDGYKWANVEIPYYGGISNKINVTFSKAFTYNLVNGKIVKTKLKSENEFTEQINKFFGIKKIALPDIKEGCIIEYMVSINSPANSSIPDWKFQKKIPVNYSEFITEIPEYLIYNVHRKGKLVPLEKKEQKNRTKSISSTNMYGGQYKSSEIINYIFNCTTYTLTNIPAIKEENFVNNFYNYSSSLEFEITQIQSVRRGFTDLATSWEDVANNIYEQEEFGDQLNKTNYFEEDLKTVLIGMIASNEKTKAIFDFVQSRMSWNKYHGIFCDDGVKKAYQDKVGNTAEINLMLVAMLRYAGLDANPVLVSTRTNGIAIFPSLKAYNIVIASVLVDGKIILLDATSKYSISNILPLNDLNWFGRIIKTDKSSEMVDLMPDFSSQHVVNTIVTIDTNGQVSGKVREQYLDYNAIKYRENFSEQTNDMIVQKIEKDHKGLEIEDYVLVTDKSVDDSVIEKYTIKDSNEADIIGDKLYFSPLLQFAIKENPFKQETREYPIDFSFPNKDKYLITITIPDGYQIESLPKPVALAMDKGYGNFSLTISNTDNQIQVTGNLSINNSIVPADDYDILKEFFKKVIEKENEKIVLKKI